MVLLALGLILVIGIQVICLFALVDQYRSLMQVRETLRLVDTPQEFPLLDVEGKRPSALGLPAALDREQVAIVLLLSTKCTTCLSVAKGLGGRLPSPGWVVIAAGSEGQAEEFQSAVGLVGERVLVDVGGRIADKLKVRVFPAAVEFVNGGARSLRAVPSQRQLRKLLESAMT